MFMESTIVRFPIDLYVVFVVRLANVDSPGNRHPREVCFKDQLSGT